MLIPVRYLGPSDVAQQAIDRHLPLAADAPAARFEVDGLEQTVPASRLSPFVDLDPRTAVGPALANLLTATAAHVVEAPPDLDLRARFGRTFRSVSDADRCLLTWVFGLGLREPWAARKDWQERLEITLPELSLITAELDAFGCHSHRAITPAQVYTRSLYGRLPLARRLRCATVLADVREHWLRYLAAYPEVLADHRVLDKTHLLDIRDSPPKPSDTDLDDLATDLDEAVLDATARAMQALRTLAADPAHHAALDAQHLREWLDDTPGATRTLPARRIVSSGALLDVLTGEALPWTEHRVIVGLAHEEIRDRFAELAGDLAFFDDDDDDPIDLSHLVLPPLPRSADAQASAAQMPMPDADTAVAWFDDGTPVHIFKDGATWVVLVPSALPLTVPPGAQHREQPDLHVVHTTEPRIELTLGGQAIELVFGDTP